MSSTVDKPRLSRAHALELLKQMIRIRRFEEKCAELYTLEKIRGFLHLYDGEEAVAVGVIPVLEKRDRVVATYREHGQALVRGVPMTAALAEIAWRRHRYGLLFRRWRRCRRRVPREPESRSAVVAAGSVRVREQSLWHGDRTS